ncbi:MAG: ATP-grasp domain-containing protein [Candidatus Bathyarchaeia archaeon]
MKEAAIQNILVIGIDAAALAMSAKKAGYNVFAAEHFGDQDLKRACKSVLSIVEQKAGESCGRLEASFSPHKLLGLAKELLAKHRIDAALLASGLDDSPQVLAELDELIPIVGNPPTTIEKVRNKTDFFHELQKLGVHHPKTMLAKNVEEGKRAAKDIGYPVMIKPLASLGGAGIRKVENSSELTAVFRRIASPREVLIQEYVSGMDASVSFLSAKEATVVLTLNEQLLGIQEVGQKEPFGYCGNIVPVLANRALMDVCEDVVQKIASHFGLVGTNGVDVVISKDGTPYIVEVNPRFQGTLECVERVLGINLVDAHVQACIKGTLPLCERKSTKFCVRLILYARYRSLVPKFVNLEEVRDVPIPEVIVEEGEPLCSLLVEGTTRSSALKKAKALARLVYEKTKPWLQ